MTSAPMMQPAGRPTAYPPHTASKAKFIAGQFLHQYYNVLQFRSKLLDRFYRDDSVLTVAGLPSLLEDDPPVLGSEAIGQRAAELFSDAKLMKEREDAPGYLLDAQEVTTEVGKQSSILLHACGDMEIAGEMFRFFQTFFLAPQIEPVGYYVKHDILRFIKENRPAPAPAAASARRPPAENGFPMVTPGYHGGHHGEAHLSQPMQANVYMPPPSAPLQHTGYSTDVSKPSMPVVAPGHAPPRPSPFAPVPVAPPQQPHIPMQPQQPPAPAATSHAHAPAIPPPAPAAAAAAAAAAAPFANVAPGKPAPAVSAAPVMPVAPAIPQPAAPVSAPVAPAVTPAPVVVAPSIPAPAPAEPEAPAPPASVEPAQEDTAPQNLTYAERLRRGVMQQQPKASPAPASVQSPAAPAAKPAQPAAPPKPAAPVAAPAAPAVSAAASNTAPAPPSAAPAPAAEDAPAAEGGSSDQDETASTTAESNCSVFVKNIPDSMTKELLVEIFSRFGPIKGGLNGVNIFLSKSYMRMAYIDFETPAGAEAATAEEVDLGAGTKVPVELKRAGRGGPRRGGYPGRGRYGGGRVSDDGRRSYDGGRGGDRAPRMPNGSYKGPRGGGAPRPDGERPMRDGMEGGRGGRGGGRGRSDRHDYGGRGARGMGRGGDGPREPRAPLPPKPTEA